MLCDVIGFVELRNCLLAIGLKRFSYGPYDMALSFLSAKVLKILFGI